MRLVRRSNPRSWLTSSLSGPRHARLNGSAPCAKNRGGIFPPGGFLTNEGTPIPSPTAQGFESWPAKGPTATAEQQSQGQHGHAHTKPSLECEFEMPYVVFEASQEAASTRDPIEGER